MKSRHSLKCAIAMLFVSICSLSTSAQSVKYSGDVEAGVVASRKFADAQIGVSTTHGAYFANPKLFVGAGALVGFNINGEYCDEVYPIYGDIRKDFTINRLFTVFIDAKAGYSINGNNTGILSDSGIDYGFYCYPSIGLRFATSRQCGIYLKLGYTYQEATESYFWATNGNIDKGNTQYNAGGFSASIGFSF